MKIAHNTPIFQSPALNVRLGKRVYFKMDCFQPTRSFKLRGMETFVKEKMAAGVKSFVSSSGGNAGYSLVYAAKALGGHSTVVVPETTGAYMREKIAALGAEVIVQGTVWDEAHAHALQLAVESGAQIVHPFDDPALWRGHSSVITECAAELPRPAAVVVAVGGGGLLCGVMEGLEAAGWAGTPVIAAETAGANSFAAAMDAGEVVTLSGIRSIAGSLGAKAVAPKALEWAAKRPIGSYVMSDVRAVAACKAFADEFGVLVEPACGAALAAVYDDAPALQYADSVLVIACGGAGIDTAIFRGYVDQFL